MGGYLAEIKSVEQEAALDGLLSYSAEYWIGLSDLSVEGAKYRGGGDGVTSLNNISVKLIYTWNDF